MATRPEIRLTGQNGRLVDEAVVHSFEPFKMPLSITGTAAEHVAYYLGKTSDEDYIIVNNTRRFLRNLTILEETDNIRLWLWYNSCREFRRYIYEGRSLHEIWERADTADRGFICRKLFPATVPDIDAFLWHLGRDLVEFSQVLWMARENTPYTRGW